MPENEGGIQYYLQHLDTAKSVRDVVVVKDGGNLGKVKNLINLALRKTR